MKWVIDIIANKALFAIGIQYLPTLKKNRMDYRFIS